MCTIKRIPSLEPIFSRDSFLIYWNDQWNLFPEWEKHIPINDLHVRFLTLCNDVWNVRTILKSLFHFLTIWI